MADKLYGHENYKDITDEFRNACKTALSDGEMVKREGFTLLEGIHALEIGHRQMDTGLIYQSISDQLANTPQIETADQALEVLDLLFSRESAWHNGSMLIQNVFSCVYVEQVLNDIKRTGPQIDDYLGFNIESWNDVVKAYILASLKCIDFCLVKFAESPAVYPEEDVIVERSTFDLLSTTPKEKLSSILEKAKQYATKQQKQQQQKSDSACGQVSHRLALRQQLLKIFGSPRPVDTSAALQALKNVTPVCKDSYEFEKTFTQLIQSRIDNPYPSRPLTSVPVKQAYESLELSLTQIQDLFTTATKITRATDRMSYIVSFASKRPRPAAIVRALLGSLVVGEDAQQWLRKDITEVIGPDALELKNPAVVQFYQDAASCYQDTLLSLCQNRTRQHRNLSHAVITWDSLEVLAETIETEAREANYNRPNDGDDVIKLPDGSTTPSMPLSSWVFMRKLQLMIWSVLLGFELEIYEPWEYPAVLNYAHSLIDSNKNHLGMVRLYLQQKMQKYKRRGGQTLIEYDYAHRYIGALELEAMGLDQLVQASLYLSIGFEKKGLIPVPKHALEFTSRKQLYLLRMKPFLTVGNAPVPPYEDCTALVEKLTLELAVGLAKNMTGSCRSVFDHLKKLSGGNPEIDLLTRSALGVSISAAMLEKISTSLPEDRMVISKSEGYHWYFPVLSVVAKK